jgi:hypothetical protein
MLNAFLTNIRVLANKSVPKTISKEPYFDKKWGTQSAFDKNVDRSNYELENTNQEQAAAAQIHDQILVMFKTTKKKFDVDRSSFLNKLAHDSMDFIQEQRDRTLRARREEELCQNSMAVMTEHIFEILKSYSYELNNALGYGHFHVAATNPQTVTEVLKFSPNRQPEETITYYRARLSTTLFSLVLRGDRHGIQFFIIPVSRAIGLSKQESYFMPIMRLATCLDNGQVTWKTQDGRQLTANMVEFICMDLFRQLIEETKAQLRRNEEQKHPGKAVSAAC